MSSVLRTRPTRSARTAGVVLAVALGLSGCGAGLRAQTYQERPSSDGTNEAIGSLAIRNIRVLPPPGNTYPEGGQARVGFVIVNEGVEDDRLVSVETDAAASVQLIGPDGRPAEDLVVPATSTVSGYAFLLEDLRQELRPGNYIELELTFEKGGTERMLVPVEVTNRPGPQREGYEVAHTDSNGDPIVSHEEGEAEGEHAEGEGASAEGEHEEPEGERAGESEVDSTERGGITSTGRQGSGAVTDEGNETGGGSGGAEQPAG